MNCTKSDNGAAERSQKQMMTKLSGGIETGNCEGAYLAEEFCACVNLIGMCTRKGDENYYKKGREMPKRQ